VGCWGSNRNGQLGAGSLAGSNVPYFPHVAGLTSLTCGDSFTCAIDGISGRPLCWGSDSNGQMGDGTNNDILTPRYVTSLGDLTQIAAGGSHTCALRADGAVFCWGANFAGQVGDGTTVDRSTPVQVSLTNAVQIAVNASHSCARKSDGSVWCWGDGQFLGTGTGTTSSTPVQIHGMPSSTAISMGGYGGGGACSIGTDLGVYCWGSDSFGQLGKGPLAPSSFVPTALTL
jgi:alpha-tubulin suppressor-like RCC1 family protein